MITVEHLTKRYGDFTAVHDISFTIEEGHVYGFLGPNGAGKSTTMNIMTGCLSATEGRVLIDGFDIYEEPRQAKRRIGYLPEQPPLYVNESPLEYLRFVGEAKGLRGAALEKQIGEVIEQTRIDDVKNRRIAALSKGYRQRVGIAQALLGDPEVIILDEPTVGLDPIQIIEIRDLIKELGTTHTVIFSSHILHEVQTICDRILMIAHGRLVAFDTPEALEQKLLAPNELTITAEAGPDEVRSILAGVEGITALTFRPAENEYSTAKLTVAGEDIHTAAREVFKAFAASDHALLELTPRKASLEDVFLELSEGGPDGGAAVNQETVQDGTAASAPEQPEALPDNTAEPETAQPAEDAVPAADPAQAQGEEDIL